MPGEPAERVDVRCQVHLVVAAGSAGLGRIARPGPKGGDAHLKLQWLFPFVSI